MNEEESGTIEQVVWIKVEEDDGKDEAKDQQNESTLYSCHTYSCNICIKTFTSRYSLTRHLRIHVDGGVKYECSTCGKSFNDKSNLIQHERIHTGEKRYTCKECQMKFTHKATLNSHSLTHTGLKAFKCTHCDMYFARGHTMRKHVGRKHNKKRIK